MGTTKEYLKIPLENAEELIIKQGGIIDEKLYNSINDLKNDVIVHFEYNHYGYDMDRAKTDEERFAIIENKTIVIAEIEREFETLIGNYELNF